MLQPIAVILMCLCVLKLCCVVVSCIRAYARFLTLPLLLSVGLSRMSCLAQRWYFCGSYLHLPLPVLKSQVLPIIPLHFVSSAKLWLAVLCSFSNRCFFFLLFSCFKFLCLLVALFVLTFSSQTLPLLILLWVVLLLFIRAFLLHFKSYTVMNFVDLAFRSVYVCFCGLASQYPRKVCALQFWILYSFFAHILTGYTHTHTFINTYIYFN